jgi:hypothetical protein
MTEPTSEALICVTVRGRELHRVWKVEPVRGHCRPSGELVDANCCGNDPSREPTGHGIHRVGDGGSTDFSLDAVVGEIFDESGDRTAQFGSHQTTGLLCLTETKASPSRKSRTFSAL